MELVMDLEGDGGKDQATWAGKSVSSGSAMMTVQSQLTRDSRLELHESCETRGAQ